MDDHEGSRFSLHKVSQLHHLVQQTLQIVVRDLALERWYERLGFFSSIGTQAAFCSSSVHKDSMRKAWILTELTALKALKLVAGCEQLLDGCNVFLLLETGEQLEVLLRLEQSLGLGHFLLDVTAACSDGVDDCARF